MFETMDITTKRRIQVFSSFTGIAILLALILSGMTLLAKNKAASGLVPAIETVLEKNRPLDFPEKYSIGKNIPVLSSSSVSTSLYEVIDKKGKVVNYVLITRVSTYYGPQAGVFLYDEQKGVSFEGFACLESRVSKQFENKESDIIIKYWKDNAMKIFKESIPVKGADHE